MIADTAQTFGVVLIVLAAAGYLLLVIRRSWRKGGGCGCCGTKSLPFMEDPASRPSVERKVEDRVPSRQMISPNVLTDAAKRVQSSETTPESPSRTSS